MSPRPETREEYSAKIPALQVLMAMGWEYIPPAQCLAMRGGNRELLLRETLVGELEKREFPWKGQKHRLSPNAIDQVVREIGSASLNEGLLIANERVYDKLTLGITVSDFVDGGKAHATIPLIDWDNPQKNRFQVTEEFKVANSDGAGERVPDIVCFVNGIPLVVIEAKRPESGNPNKSMIAEGISQQIRNQKNGEIPHLFAYAQLLLAISGTDARYGATKTPTKFWTLWREEELESGHFREVKNTELSEAQKAGLFAARPPKARKYFEQKWSLPVVPSSQDRLLISLLSKERLLEMVRYFMVFDKKVGKVVARYQQFFGVRRMLAQVTRHNKSGGREGGVIWHTTGSGKSFTMVFLSKALLLHKELSGCRLIIVTDRLDLEKQLFRVFVSAGAFGSAVATKKDGERAKARSGNDLARRIGKSNDRIVFTIINKFNTAAGLKDCHNPSDKIIVLVDEGHRSQGGANHELMRKALPNAAFIAFTGTPLLKEDKTRQKFGPIIHAYTMQRAEEDGTVTPLVYEERQPVLEVNEEAIDNWFDKVTADLSEQQKTDLKKKFANKKAVYGSENRQQLIAWDIALHFSQNIKPLDMGLKGQLATDSKLSAIRYKRLLDDIGLVTSAVVISPPDTREGHQDVDESKIPEVQQWFKDTVGSVANAQAYERRVIEDFSTEGRPDIMIVCSKLLTGFDEPRNTVLYIDKPLREHELIQAIARVNRLHEAKDFGLLLDYRGILKELDTAIKEYQDLEARTQGGYDIADLEGLYHQVSYEYKKLPQLHKELWDIFKDVKNRLDLEQFRQVLMPHHEEDEDGNSYDTRQKVREDFYQALTKFGMCFKLALSSRSFHEDGSFSAKDIRTYREDLRFFVSLRKIARQDAQETIDYSQYEKQIRALVDKHVVGVSIKAPEGRLPVGGLGASEDPKEWSEEKKRNETDIIKTRVKKTIEQTLAEDPYAQKVFSQLLKEAIAQAESLFDRPYDLYKMFKGFEDQVEARAIEGMPAALSGNPRAKAYYGTFRLVLGEEEAQALEDQKEKELAEEALAIDEVVNTSVAENSLNPKDMEAAINKRLLPRLFKLFGLDRAKVVIGHIIQITRIRLSRESN